MPLSIKSDGGNQLAWVLAIVVTMAVVGVGMFSWSFILDRDQLVGREEFMIVPVLTTTTYKEYSIEPGTGVGHALFGGAGVFPMRCSAEIAEKDEESEGVGFMCGSSSYDFDKFKQGWESGIKALRSSGVEVTPTSGWKKDGEIFQRRYESDAWDGFVTYNRENDEVLLLYFVTR